MDLNIRYAPSFHSLFANLDQAVPGLVQDIAFVGHHALKAFEEVQDGITGTRSRDEKIKNKGTFSLLAHHV